MKKLRGVLLTISIIMLGYTKVHAETALTLGDFIKIYVQSFSEGIPPSYKYIKVNYLNVPYKSNLYFSLQKGIYLNLLPNPKIELGYTKIINQEIAVSLIRTKFDKVISYDKTKQVTASWLKTVLEQLHEKPDIEVKDNLTNTIYEILKDEYIYPEKLDDTKMKYGAIKGFVDALDDNYTEFMPPDNAKSFNDQIGGSFEGIGAYVEMHKEGTLLIVAPIEGSPAEKAGLLAGDQIIKIDDITVTKTMSLNEAVTHIKGPKGTKVLLTIVRNGEELKIEVTRDEVIVKNVTYKILTGNICYIKIAMFNMGVYRDFRSAIENITKNTCERYIFDVRNDPGGSLQDVVSMLYYFVPTKENVVIIKDRNTSIGMTAADRKPKLTNEKIVILINEGSASASEIFAGTIREYAPHSVLIGENSFGKGSVQTLTQFGDGSVLKYTTAKWYTGKGEKNIDGEGIVPDVEIKDNPDTKMDEPLEIAKIYEFK